PSVLHKMQVYPSDLAVSSTALANSGKKGFIMSGTSKAIILERPLYNILARSLGSYSISCIISSTIIFVWALALPLLFNTLETVAVDTPASSATFLIVTIHTTFL